MRAKFLNEVIKGSVESSHDYTCVGKHSRTYKKAYNIEKCVKLYIDVICIYIGKIIRLQVIELQILIWRWRVLKSLTCITNENGE